MKTEITADGHLNITAETPTESYALKCFYQENFDPLEKLLRGENIFFDWTVHPATHATPAKPNPVSHTWEHRVEKCIVCGGHGKYGTDMCYNCNGTGNVWV